MTNNYDIIVCGGGIAGLWLANTLMRAGYNVILIEKDRLGAGQTLASQGMIHGGQKYVLTGALSSHAQAISSMPERWQACLEGTSEIDLRPVDILSATQVMWPAGSMLSSAAVFAAAKLVNAKTTLLEREALPAALKQSAGPVYSLPEKVLNMRSLVGVLARNLAGRVLQGDITRVQSDGSIRVSGQDLRAQRIVFTAGAGNELALKLLQGHDSRTQRRPLRQIMVRPLPDALFGHGIVSNSHPRITVTSHRCEGGYVWYLGGGVAEKGASMDETAALRFARTELNAIFPALDWRTKEWATWHGDRAEPLDAAGQLPAGPAVHECGRVLLAWPVKLTFAPALADRVHKLLLRDEIAPASGSEPPPLPAAEIGGYPWDAAAWRTLG
jgi:glycine/D-amino acid oxidase-like deaminating enzyme